MVSLEHTTLSMVYHCHHLWSIMRCQFCMKFNENAQYLFLNIQTTSDSLLGAWIGFRHLYCLTNFVQTFPFHFTTFSWMYSFGLFIFILINITYDRWNQCHHFLSQFCACVGNTILCVAFTFQEYCTILIMTLKKIWWIEIMYCISWI